MFTVWLWKETMLLKCLTITSQSYKVKFRSPPLYWCGVKNLDFSTQSVEINVNNGWFCKHRIVFYKIFFKCGVPALPSRGSIDNQRTEQSWAEMLQHKNIPALKSMNSYTLTLTGLRIHPVWVSIELMQYWVNFAQYQGFFWPIVNVILYITATLNILTHTGSTEIEFQTINTFGPNFRLYKVPEQCLMQLTLMLKCSYLTKG